MTASTVSTVMRFEKRPYMGIELDILTGHPDHERLFVATQVARAVGLKNPSTSISEYRKTKEGAGAGCTLLSVIQNFCIKDIPTDLAGRRLKGVTTLFTESEVNRLLMRGSTEKAYEFQTWLAEDVVPTIVRTGKYDLSESTSDFAKELQAFRLRFEEQDKVIATQAQEIAALIPLRGQVESLRELIETTAKATAIAAMPSPYLGESMDTVEGKYSRDLNRRTFSDNHHLEAPWADRLSIRVKRNIEAALLAEWHEKDPRELATRPEGFKKEDWVMFPGEWLHKRLSLSSPERNSLVASAIAKALNEYPAA